MLVGSIEILVDSKKSRMALSTSGTGVGDPSGTRVERASSTALEASDIGTDIAGRRDEATERRAVAVVVAVVINDPASASSRSASLKLGKKRVHQNMRRKLLSMTRRLKMKATTSKKKQRPPRIRSRSSQSDFSRAVIRCLEVLMRSERESC